MVSQKERALIEARAKGIDVDAAIAHPLRSMLHLDLLASSLAISVFLLIYYASVTVLTIYWVVVFDRTSSQANGINTWYWSLDAVMLVVIGLLSDRLKVRKPFMVIGAIGVMAMTIVMIVQTGHPHATYLDNVLVVLPLGAFIAFTYAPWMAAYTEAVEAKNPALAATGLAVWGWMLRIVVAVSFLALPRVITTATTLVNNQNAGAELQVLQSAVPYVPTANQTRAPLVAPQSLLAQLRTLGPPGQALSGILAKHPATFSQLEVDALALPKGLLPQALALQSFTSATSAMQSGAAPSAKDVASVKANSPNDLYPLLLAAEKLVPAQQKSPNEWKNWWWVSFGGQVVFLVLVFFMKGRWSPRAAKRDFDEYELKIEEEIRRLRPASA
jgi:hypothetical protein